jgi:chemotaxis family two-component system response regulator Rcp1
VLTRLAMRADIPQRNPSILLIEDNPGDVRLIRDGLAEAQSKASLSVVSSGDEALQWLRSSHDTAPTDLILLDLNLPGKDGADVLTELKADFRFRRIPVIVLTSSRSELDVNTAYDCGASLYLTKPSDLEAYYRIIQQLHALFIESALLPTSSNGGPRRMPRLVG